MVAGCPLDRHILLCLLRYQPELVLLAFLTLVFCACLWKFMA